MKIDSKTEKPFSFEFIDEGSNVLLGLTNETDQTLKSVEVLTVFLKDEDTPGGGPSQASIKFKDTECVYPKQKVVLSHRTWINGKPVESNRDQLERLESSQVKSNLTCWIFHGGRGREIKVSADTDRALIRS